LEGNDIKVLWNRAIANTIGNGFVLKSGLRFTVLMNTAKKNLFGIQATLSAQDSTLLSNVALDNELFDLRDVNDNCDKNTWKVNWFRTSQTNPPDAGCIR
jgi:hypothetical protein